MESEFRKAFYHAGERLHSYALRHEKDDTQLAMVRQLAFERNCGPEDIEVYLEECAPKERDFSRDCAVEHLGMRSGRDNWRILNVATGALYAHSGPLESFIHKFEAGEAQDR